MQCLLSAKRESLRDRNARIERCVACFSRWCRCVDLLYYYHSAWSASGREVAQFLNAATQQSGPGSYWRVADARFPSRTQSSVRLAATGVLRRRLST